jgi:hypothetical protein
MKRLPLVTVVMVALALFSSWKAVADSQQSTDFGFRFDVSGCLNETFDTFSGVFTRDLDADARHVVTAQFSLPQEKMNLIHTTVQTIRFFDYPSPYYGVPAGVKTLQEFGPAKTYRLEVREAGVVHQVMWHDAHRPTTADADRLRALLEMILGAIHEHPDYKRLPPRTRSCE